MAENTTNRKTTKDQLNHVVTLVETVKKDSLVQFGELKKDLGSVDGRLNSHDKRLNNLEKDKIERDAIAKYQKEHPELAQKVFDTGKKAYDDNSSSISINKDLMKAIGWLVVALGVVVAALLALKHA